MEHRTAREEGHPFAVHDLLAGLPLLGEQEESIGRSLQAQYPDTQHETLTDLEDAFQAGTVLRIDALERHELDDFSPFEDSDSLMWGNLPPLEPIRKIDTSINKDIDDDDLWQSNLSDFQSSPPEQHLHSWEAFYSNISPSQARATPAFLSEAGPNAFDAALEEHSNVDSTRKTAGRVVQSGALKRALLQAGLGRSSLLFPLNPSGELEPALKDARMSGYSLDSFSEIIVRFVGIGNTVRRLRQFAQDAYSSSTSCAAEVALARATESVLDAIEESIFDTKSIQSSLLQLVQEFEQPSEAISAVKSLVDAATAAAPRTESFNASMRDLRVLENAFDFIVTHAGQSLLVEEIWKQVLASVARPWLDCVAQDMGLTIYKAGNTERANLLAFSEEDKPQIKPRFLSDADIELLEDTQNSMLHLIYSLPDHPLAVPQGHTANLVELEWCLDWGDVERVEAQAKQYERGLLNAIEQYSLGQSGSTIAGPSSVAHEVVGEQSAFDLDNFSEADILQQQAVLDASPNLQEIPGDLITKAMLSLLGSGRTAEHNLDQEHQQLPYTLMPNLTMSSLLRTQNHILSHVVLHSMLHTHNLRGHIHVHRLFSLFSSGLFATRLGDALFSTTLESTERRKGHLRSGGTMGLNLGGDKRRNWPPASSELRLALSGILSECWQAEQQRAMNSSTTIPQQPHTNEARGNIPGELSFSIRNLSPEQIDEILSPHSLHALDFLRLSESLPPSVSPILTEKSQKNYDRAFAFLLRLLRVRFTVSDQIPRDLRLLERSRVKTNDRRNDVLENVVDDDLLATLRRLQHAANHFVQAVSSHCVLFAAEGPLAAFCLYLDRVADVVSSPIPSDSAASTSNRAPSLAQLAARHEAASATVAANLFVRRKQSNVAAALEQCLNSVLMLGRCVRKCLATTLGQESPQEHADAEEDGTEDGLPEPRELWHAFVAHVAHLADECEALGQNHQYIQEQDDASGADSAAALLLRLRGDGAEWF